MATLCGILVIKQPMYIYTCPGLRKIQETYDEREQYVAPTYVEEILCRFNEVHDSWPVNQLRYTLRFNYIMDSDKAKVDKMVERYITKGCF
jgi:hypothetical protein